MDPCRSSAIVTMVCVGTLALAALRTAAGVSNANATANTAAAGTTPAHLAIAHATNTNGNPTNGNPTNATALGVNTTRASATNAGLSKENGAAAADVIAIRSALEIPRERAAELRDRALSETLERELLKEALVTTPSAEAIADYYERYRDRYVKPEAIDVWRILVASEEQAKALLAQIKASPTPQRAWSLAAREHSADKATHFRKGHLGYVRADGSTDVPQVRVSPAVFAAAHALKDGVIGEAPFREGEYWALVWRRGSRKEERVTLELAREEIVQQLSLSAARTLLTEALASLRAGQVTDYHPDLVDHLPVPVDTGFVTRRAPRRPHPADGSPTPRKTDRGER